MTFPCGFFIRRCYLYIAGIGCWCVFYPVAWRYVLFQLVVCVLTLDMTGHGVSCATFSWWCVCVLPSAAVVVVGEQMNDMDEDNAEHLLEPEFYDIFMEPEPDFLSLPGKEESTQRLMGQAYNTVSSDAIDQNPGWHLLVQAADLCREGDYAVVPRRECQPSDEGLPLLLGLHNLPFFETRAAFFLWLFFLRQVDPFFHSLLLCVAFDGEIEQYAAEVRMWCARSASAAADLVYPSHTRFAAASVAEVLACQWPAGASRRLICRGDDYNPRAADWFSPWIFEGYSHAEALAAANFHRQRAVGSVERGTLDVQLAQRHLQQALIGLRFARWQVQDHQAILASIDAVMPALQQSAATEALAVLLPAQPLQPFAMPGEPVWEGNGGASRVDHGPGGRGRGGGRYGGGRNTGGGGGRNGGQGRGRGRG